MIETDSAVQHAGCMEEIAPRIHHLRMHYKLPDADRTGASA